jgi:CheY-like chemotaxis protein
MDAVVQQKIFDPFFTTKEMGRGTGLGLASAYGIIKSHGGFIDVQSKKGIGSTFSLYLPRSRGKVVEEKEPTDEIIKGKEFILLVDDEQMILDVARQILQKLGYQVTLASGGRQAVTIYEKMQDQIDMVILDMIMPDLSGGETYDKIKEINSGVKVLLSSGYSMDGEATEILKRGCHGFIQKPFNMKNLSRKIREILDEN